MSTRSPSSENPSEEAASATQPAPVPAQPAARPRDRRRVVLLAVAGIALATALGLVIALLMGDDKDTSATPDYVPPAPSGPTTGTLVPAPATAVGKQMAPVPRGKATRVKVTNPDGKLLVDAPLSAFPASRSKEFAPDQGQAAWWESGKYGAPAVSRQSVVSAHVRFDGVPDAFYNLGSAVPGAQVAVTFDSGDSAVYRVTEKLEAPKADVVDGKTEVGRKVWEGAELSLVTCDLESGTYDDGHLRGNTVLITERLT